MTGGGGFLGKKIVEKLIAQGHSVRTFSRGRYPELEAAGAEHVQGTIEDLSALETACAGIDSVIHTAARAGVWGRYEEYYSANVTGTENVISACLRTGVDRLIHTSTPSVILNGENLEGVDESFPYPETFHSHYSKTKALAEKAVSEAAGKGLKTIILRPHIIWGPGDSHLVPRVLERGDRFVQIGDGRNRVDTIYVDNAADAHILAMEKLETNPELAGNIYFICQNEPILLWEMINRILTWAGIGPVKRSVSHRTAYLAATLVESVYRLFKVKKEPLLTRYIVSELSTSHWFDTGAAERDLGFIPAISMRDGMDVFESWVKELAVSAGK